MRTYISLEDAAGKTIEGFFLSVDKKYVALTFSEDSFSILGIDYSYSPGNEFITQYSMAGIVGNIFSDSDLVRYGVATQEEIDHERKMRYEDYLKENANKEFEKYLELKKIYGTLSEHG